QQHAPMHPRHNSDGEQRAVRALSAHGQSRRREEQRQSECRDAGLPHVAARRPAPPACNLPGENAGGQNEQPGAGMRLAGERADQQGRDQRGDQERDRAPQLVPPGAPQVSAEEQQRAERKKYFDAGLRSHSRLTDQPPLARAPAPSTNRSVTSSPTAIRLLTHFKISSMPRSGERAPASGSV